jgi:hypothetical protein
MEYKLIQLLTDAEIKRTENLHVNSKLVLDKTLSELTVEDLRILFSCLSFKNDHEPHQVHMVNSLVELLNREIEKSGILEKYK